MLEISTTIVPRGNRDFEEAVERLRNSGDNCTNRFELANYCCKLCRHEMSCEDCFVQTVGDLADPFRKAIEKQTTTGMYSSGFHFDKNTGKYQYSHPQGSG